MSVCHCLASFPLPRAASIRSVQTMVESCDSPALDLKFINIGIGGDGPPGGNNRFKRDVLPFTATAMTVVLG